MVNKNITAGNQGSHASWKILEGLGIFIGKSPGLGKSWKMTLVLETPGIC